jgi:hypothetical protein
MDADRLTLPALTRLTHVNVERERERLRNAGVTWIGGALPEAWRVDQAARIVIGWSRASAAMSGGVWGLAGALGVLPEYVAQLVGLTRLAQRLALLHGVDPQTDHGRLIVGEALAFGLDVPLPPGGIGVMRVTEALRALGAVPASSMSVPAQVVTALAVRTPGIGARIARMAPIVASGVAAVAGQDRVTRLGWRMHAWFGDRFQAPHSLLMEDAFEVGGEG